MNEKKYDLCQCGGQLEFYAEHNCYPYMIFACENNKCNLTYTVELIQDFKNKENEGSK